MKSQAFYMNKLKNRIASSISTIDISTQFPTEQIDFQFESITSNCKVYKTEMQHAHKNKKF